jgi:hypothetical protein
MATITSLSDQPKTEGQQQDGQGVGKRGVNLSVGVLWIIGATALWNVLLVVFHYVTDRLLGR